MAAETLADRIGNWAIQSDELVSANGSKILGYTLSWHANPCHCINGRHAH